MLDQLTSVQLSEWEAYDRLDPIGSWRRDFGTAQLISTITNIANAIYKAEGKEAVVTDVSDFMPVWDKEARKKKAIKQKLTPEQSQEELTKALLDFARRHNEREEIKSKPPIKRRT